MHRPRKYLHRQQYPGMLPDMTSVTMTLRSALEKCGQTRYMVSKATGIPQSVLSRFTAGSPMKGENIDKLSDYLGLVLTKKPGRARKER